jgi:hypothetical protein
MKFLDKFFMCFFSLLLINAAVSFSQNLRQADPALQREFDEHITQLRREGAFVKIAPDERTGNDRYAFTIKPDAMELCNKIMEFIENGGTVMTFQQNWMFIVSIDEDRKNYILTDSGM